MNSSLIIQHGGVTFDNSELFAMALPYQDKDQTEATPN